MLGARSSAHPLCRAPSIRFFPAERVLMPETVRTVQNVGENVKTAVRMHREALCGNHISGAPRYRRNPTRWLISTQPSTMSCMASVQPLITWLGAKDVGEPRSYELSKTVPSMSLPS